MTNFFLTGILINNIKQEEIAKQIVMISDPLGSYDKIKDDRQHLSNQEVPCHRTRSYGRRRGGSSAAMRHPRHTRPRPA